jgi:tRNA/tmRNA/rRNA uracil-C5-methylase (TrmA/RlmC/RlmD family)
MATQPNTSEHWSSEVTTSLSLSLSHSSGPKLPSQLSSILIHTSQAYQHSASFVPKLATKVLNWLDTQPSDQILDIGCGDGVINLDLALTLSTGTGRIHGIDASPAMIASAQKAAASDPRIAKICTFEGISLLLSPNASRLSV